MAVRIHTTVVWTKAQRVALRTVPVMGPAAVRPMAMVQPAVLLIAPGIMWSRERFVMVEVAVITLRKTAALTLAETTPV